MKFLIDSRNLEQDFKQLLKESYYSGVPSTCTEVNEQVTLDRVDLPLGFSHDRVDFTATCRSPQRRKLPECKECSLVTHANTKHETRYQQRNFKTPANDFWCTSGHYVAEENVNEYNGRPYEVVSWVEKVIPSNPRLTLDERGVDLSLRPIGRRKQWSKTY